MPQPRMWCQRVRRSVQLGLGLLTVVLALVGSAGNAGAHEQVVASDPADGALLETAPERVRIEFSGPFDITAFTATARDASGDTLEVGAVRRSPGRDDEVVFPVEAGSDGAATLTWWLIGDDGHPLSGSITWTVGAAPEAGTTVGAEGARDVLAAAGAPQDGGPIEIDGLASTSRLLTYLALALLIGFPIFLISVWPGGAPGPMTGPLLVVGGIAGLLGPVLRLGAAASSLGLPGGVAAGLELVAGSESSRPLLAQAALMPILAQLSWHATRHRRPRWLLLAAGAGLAMVYAQIAQGHGTSAGPVGLLGQAVHLVAVSVWAGSLIALLVVALPTWTRRGTLHEEARHRLRSFSRLAAIDLGALVASGGVLLYDRWSRADGLSSGYSTILVVKLSVVAAVIIAALGCHRWVNSPHPSSPAIGLTRRVALETGSLGGALAVTAVLAGVTFLPPITPVNPNEKTTGVPDRVIEMTSRSFAFEPAILTVKPKEEIQLAFVAEDTMHDFVIEGSEAPIAALPGMVGRGYFRIDEPGTYAFYCSIDGHRQAGMTGTLTVED